jgi:ribosomal protein S18 acetylase RimI-like enzyme
MGILIRPWQKEDLATISRITLESWISTYSSFIPESDIRSYLDAHYEEASLLRLFDDPSMYGFIAETDDQIVGYARLVFDWNEHRLFIFSLHVVQKFQGQGIGRQLLEAAEGYAAGKRLDEIWIGVMVKNKRALLIYRKGGFLFVQEEPFPVGKTTVAHLAGYKKLGRSTLLHHKTYAFFDERQKSNALPALCLELLSDQKKAWQDLRDGYESFKNVRERDLSCRYFRVRIQHNPGRLKSCTAGTGPNSENRQPCFLCLDHLSQGEKGILYQNEYLILCNPMPILSSHFTVSHLDHRLQAIDEHIGTFLQLMVDLGPGWVILYNGRQCGASAPEHLHFQAARSGRMLIEKEIREGKRLALVKEMDDVLFYRVNNLGREAILLEGSDPMAVEHVFKGFLNGLQNVLLLNEEPMINIVGFYEGRKWRLIVFPRRKHRPDAFFKEGNDRVVVSPGAIDMGGLVITPVERDFECLDAAAVKIIYREVSLGEETVEKAIHAMR